MAAALWRHRLEGNSAAWLRHEDVMHRVEVLASHLQPCAGVVNLTRWVLPPKDHRLDLETLLNWQFPSNFWQNLHRQQHLSVTAGETLLNNVIMQRLECNIGLVFGSRYGSTQSSPWCQETLSSSEQCIHNCICTAVLLSLGSVSARCVTQLRRLMSRHI